MFKILEKIQALKLMIELFFQLIAQMKLLIQLMNLKTILKMRH